MDATARLTLTLCFKAGVRRHVQKKSLAQSSLQDRARALSQSNILKIDVMGSLF